LFVKKFAIGLCGFVLILFLQESCTKIDTTTLGVDLIPTVDNVTTFDTTLEVISSSYFLPDSTTIGATASHALGTLEDPAFGKTHADIYFRLNPVVATANRNPFINKDSAQIIDSVVLSLGYQGLYGDSTSVQNIKVFEIDPLATNFDDTLTGYRIDHPDFAVLPTVLGQKLVNFTTLNDSLQVILKQDTARVASELHIRLDNSFGRRLADYDTTNAYKTGEFENYVRGFAIKADEASSPLRRALAYFDLATASKTRLRVYYRTPGKDTLAAEFTFQGYANANTVKRTTTGSEYANNIASSIKNKDKLYLQSSPGSQAILTVPGLKGMDNRVIYKAELIMPIIPSTENNIFTIPNFLFLDQVDSAKNRYLTIKNDFILSGTNSQGYNYETFGGVPKNNQYIFDLSRHVQLIVTQKIPVLSFRVYAPYTTYPNYYQPNTKDTTAMALSKLLVVNYPVAFGRVVIAGGSNVNPPNNRMRLRIIYSKI
jgi:hypothetical protein